MVPNRATHHIYYHAIWIVITWFSDGFREDGGLPIRAIPAGNHMLKVSNRKQKKV